MIDGSVMCTFTVMSKLSVYSQMVPNVCTGIYRADRFTATTNDLLSKRLTLPNLINQVAIDDSVKCRQPLMLIDQNVLDSLTLKVIDWDIHLFRLHGFAVGGFEADALVDEVVHDEVVLLLDVAQDAEPVAGRHGEASSPRCVQRHEHILRRQGEIRPVEVQHHGRVRRIAHPRRGEAKLQSVERTVCHWIRNLCLHRLMAHKIIIIRT
jgi:hypothetical protein